MASEESSGRSETLPTTSDERVAAVHAARDLTEKTLIVPASWTSEERAAAAGTNFRIIYKAIREAQSGDAK